MKPVTFTCYVPSHVDSAELHRAFGEAVERATTACRPRNPEPKIPDGYAMSASAKGQPYAAFRKAGWTDAQLKSFGYLEPTPPLWRAWHLAKNRLAPLGVTVEIRDKSGKRIVQWMFGTGHRTAFSVKSWRFMTEQGAIADDKRRYAAVFKQSIVEGLAGLKVTSPTPLPVGAVLRGGVAFGSVVMGEPCRFSGGPTPQAQNLPKPDPMRWRVTEAPGAHLPKGLQCEVIVPPLPDLKVRWRFKYRIDAEAYDNVQAAKR